MKTTIINCDIKDCTNVSNREEPLELDVIFTSEQTEGRSCPPYLSSEKVDLCPQCINKVLEGNYIWANGAQGHNTYYFKK